jgi:hypothetical protein
MSILSLPRIHFTGATDWSPSTGNNASSTYDLASVAPVLQTGVTYATFLDWMKQRTPALQQPNGSWNIYGDHATRFAETRFTGADLAIGRVTSDPLFASGIDLRGLNYFDGPAPARLVMTDPFTGGEATSQIFYQWIVAGATDGISDPAIGFKAGAACRMFSRWPFQNRNIDYTFKEGMVGCTWQAAAHNQDIQWFGLDKSPVLAALHDAANRGSNRGIVIRFASYRTLYYQSATWKGKRIENGLDLVAAYEEGFTGDNPARSAMVGSIGVWEAGELASAQTGRFLVPAQSAQLADSPAIAPLGPATAAVDTARNVVVLDLIGTFPELNVQLDKANFGTFQLQSVDAKGVVTNIAPVPYSSYDRSAYESGGGIVEFPISPGAARKIAAGSLQLVQTDQSQSFPVLAQTQFVAETDDWGVYVDECQTPSVTIKVTENGAAPQPGLNLWFQQYDSNGNLLDSPVVQVLDANGKPASLVEGNTNGGTLSGQSLPVSGGSVTLRVQSLAPGACSLSFYPYRGQPPSQIPTSAFPLPASFYCAIRMLPFDDALERYTPDSMLSWSFIYTNVLRVFDLVYPVMSKVRNLADLNVIEQMAEQLKFAVSLDTFESTLYMPITRDLSAGKRKLLQRFVNLLPNEIAPDPPESAA